MDGKIKITETRLPADLSLFLNVMGIKKITTSAPKPQRTYEFRMPIFDENGEPDF